jgi:hypothetical protein
MRHILRFIVKAVPKSLAECTFVNSHQVIDPLRLSIRVSDRCACDIKARHDNRIVREIQMRGQKRQLRVLETLSMLECN